MVLRFRIIVCFLSGRAVEDEANVHQCSATNFGRRKLGPGMPWSNRAPADARLARAALARAFLAAISLLGIGTTVAAEPAVVSVPRWEMHEFVMHGRAQGGNPFCDSALVGRFTAPSGRTLTVEGFYDGEDTWRLRFTPDEEGKWRYVLRGDGVVLHQQGRLRATPPRRHGFIGIHPKNPYAFAYADGTPFCPMGDTCYGFYTDSSTNPELRAEYLKARRAQRINYVRMGAVHSPTHWESDPACWPWGGTPQRPDLDRINPRYFAGLDAVLNQMRAAGMNAELLVLNFYQRPFTDTRAWTPVRERRWLRYLVARYAAFPNVFMWTIANEYETHPDGAYRLDVPTDVNWAKATACFIKAHDPYHHLVTVHPVISSSVRGKMTADPIDPPWRIGGFFGTDGAMDVLSQQTGQTGEGVTWDEALQCWRGDDPDLVASIRADRRYGRPVLNSESGYEYRRGYPTYNRQVHHTDKVRRSAWRIVCAGGYFAVGFAGTLGMGDFWNNYGPERYPFIVSDEGAGAQLAALHRFFASLPYWRMQPFGGVAGEMAVALAEPGKVYVVYLPRGGKVIVDLSAARGCLAGRWFNPRDGRFVKAFRVNGGAKVQLTAPDQHDWALHLEARSAKSTRTPR